MKRASDLSYIIHETGLNDNPVTSGFLSLDGPGFLTYSDEAELSQILLRLQNSNVPSKDVLILKEFKGRMFQKCPGSQGMICCNYYLINTCFDCLYSCSYCFLRSYLNSYGITQFTNTDRAFDEITASAAFKSGRLLRVGTGEFTDSLMFDEITGIGRRIIEFAAAHPSVIIEFKTKSDNINHLLDIKDRGRTVLAWSLNLQDRIARYEEGTAGLEERLDAARRASESGYYVAFHFDPLILTDESVGRYEAVIDRIYQAVKPGRVLWISIGGLRYTPAFRELLRFSGPGERLMLSEMLAGPDGKMRYLKSQRIRIYRSLLNKIRSLDKEVFVYMCMESAEVWEEVFGVRYETSDELENAFITSLESRFI